MSVVYFAHSLPDDLPDTGAWGPVTPNWGPRRTFENAAEYESSSEWRYVRAIWRGRHQDDICCFICGRSEEIDLHHLGYDEVGFAEDWRILDRLVSLCTHHHHEIERRIRRHGWSRNAAHTRYRAEVESRRGGDLHPAGSSG